MVELKAFIKALKISWPRRILQQSTEAGWKELSFINFTTLYSFDGCFTAKLTHENHLGKKVFGWSEFYKIVPTENIGHVLESPIWYKYHIEHGRFFVKNWFDNCIRVIYDIMGKNGIFYIFEQALYNIRGTFLDYQRIVKSIPHIWKTLINDNRVFIRENRHNVI